MTAAQYIVDSLVRRGVTDAFGIPGGVLLKLIYEMDERKGFEPHLSYHEQSAGFAACGYAQASGKLGVAYATRGPGFTNLISAIADAYYDSLPVLFITAHAAPCPPEGMRVMADQEMDTCSMVRNITKMAVRADDINGFTDTFEHLCDTALQGRKGPVLLDISSRLFLQELSSAGYSNCEHNHEQHNIDAVSDIVTSIRSAERPVILVGDGVSQANARNYLNDFVRQAGIPVISSRFSHDLIADTSLYFGYVGSHGLRTANFILSKCDLLVSMGNRLHFPVASKTFCNVFNHARLIRCEIDEGEFLREVPNSTCYHCDILRLLKEITSVQHDYGNHQEWVRTCQVLKSELKEEDMNDATKQIAELIKKTPSDWSIVNDVGNNEFWVSRASVYCEDKHRTFYSKSFGALGCALGKAIGTYYATKKPVLCFTGDQGLQINIQELQFVAQHHLPIIVALINNGTSGMIRDRQISYGHYLHTTRESGFANPSWKKIADAYGLAYIESDVYTNAIFENIPCLLNIKVDENISLTPNLPKGTTCQDMSPRLLKEQYECLNNL